VQEGTYLPLMGQLNLQCDYTPILQLDAIAVGANPAFVQPVAENVAQQAIFGARTIKLPALNPLLSGQGPTLPVAISGPGGRVYAVWTYTAGYPHLKLEASASLGDTHIVVQANGPSGTVLGVYPGTILTIDDLSFAEDVIVSGVSGTTLTLNSPLTYAHTVPEAPDFIPVTALPGDVTQAAIFITTALIKTRGDLSLALSGIEEARDTMPTADAVTQDVSYALSLLEPFRVVSKQRS
jgi:hypothetical protein